MTTRRELVLGAAALAAVTGTRTAHAQPEGDAAILASVTELELLSVFVYEAGIATGALDAELTDVAELFRDQEQEHADGLAAALEAIGGARPEKPADMAAAEARLEKLGLPRGLGGLRRQDEILRFAIELESAAVAAYHEAHQRLQDAKLLQTATSIMANEGQHLVVLRQALGRPPVPHAFETGKG